MVNFGFRANLNFRNRIGAFISTMASHKWILFCGCCSLTGRKLDCLNFGSYNYLGFADDYPPCRQEVERTTLQYGVGVGGSRQELGKLLLFNEHLMQCLNQSV